MPVQGFEHQQKRRGPKNILIGVRPLPLLMWQRTDKDGIVQTELGVEITPGDIRKLPTDLWNKSGPVNAKLQKLLAKELHGSEAVSAEPIMSKEKAAAQLPAEVDVG